MTSLSANFCSLFLPKSLKQLDTVPLPTYHYVEEMTCKS